MPKPTIAEQLKQNSISQKKSVKKAKRPIRSKPFGHKCWSFNYVKEKVLECITANPGKCQAQIFYRLNNICGPGRTWLAIKELTEENLITFSKIPGKWQKQKRIYQAVI